jgi:hypothetical protein
MLLSLLLLLQALLQCELVVEHLAASSNLHLHPLLWPQPVP